MSGDDRKASSKPSFLYGSTASKREKAAQHATGGKIYSPEQMPSFVPLGHDQAEHAGISQQGFEIELQSILDEIAARSRRLRLKHPQNDAGNTNGTNADFPNRSHPVSEAVDRLLDEFAHFEALLGEDPRLDHLRFSILTLDSCIARLNYRHVDIRQSPGIEAIIARIEADLKALDRQIRDETSVTQETSPNHDATLDITLIQLSEAILGLSDKVGRLTDNQEQIAAHTVNLGTLKNSVAAISAATLDQVGRQIAGIDTRFGTLDQGLTRLSEQMNAIHAQLAEPTPRPEPNRPQDSHVASEELKSHIASLQDRMSKSGQQNFAAMSAVLAGTERILERVSRVEDSVKAELKRHEFVSQPSRLKQSSPSETGNALDPRAVIKAARAAIARAREEAGLELDASQQKIGPKSFADPLGA